MAGIDAVQEYCGWHIAPSRPDILKVEGNGGRVLLLPSLHVTDCSAIHDENGAAVTEAKVRENGIARGRWVDEVLYEFNVTHGYEWMPAEVQEIIDDLNARSGSAGAVVQVGQVRMATDKDGAPLGAALSSAQRAVLERYRIKPGP